MSAAVLPSDATDPSVTWSVATLSGGAASISASGLLSATTAGTVTVTATNAASGKTGTLVVTVNSVVAVTALAVTGAKSATSVVTGSTLQMSSTPTPSNASDSSVTWSIAAGGTGTATINATSGVLSATGVGTVTVKATNAASGVVGTQTVTIYSAVGFIPTSGTTTTTTLATKVASVKTSTADINVPFCFNGLTITKIDYNGVMDFATSQYAAVGNNLVLYKTVAPTTLAGASAGDRTLTITLSNGLTYAFTVTIS